jgi:hypothetical protein
VRQAVCAHTLDGDLTDRAAHQLLDSSMFLSIGQTRRRPPVGGLIASSPPDDYRCARRVPLDYWIAER